METKLHNSEEWFNMNDSVLVYSNKSWIFERKVYKTRKGSLVINDIHIEGEPKSCSMGHLEWRNIEESEVEILTKDYNMKKQEELRSHNEKEI